MKLLESSQRNTPLEEERKGARTFRALMVVPLEMISDYIYCMNDDDLGAYSQPRKNSERRV